MTFGYTSTSSDTSWAGTSGWHFSFRVYMNTPAAVPRPNVCAHALFGLSCAAPFAEVRRVYRRLARIAHPDFAPPERKWEMGQWMVVINRAFEAFEKGAA